MNPMKIINLTPHEIVVSCTGTNDGEHYMLSIPPSGKVARVSEKQGSLLNPIRVTTLEGNTAEITVAGPPQRGAVTDLPEPENDTIYLVSGLVLAQCTGRTDVFAPGTGPLDGCIRGSNGQPIAVTRLIAATA